MLRSSVSNWCAVGGVERIGDACSWPLQPSCETWEATKTATARAETDSGNVQSGHDLVSRLMK